MPGTFICQFTRCYQSFSSVRALEKHEKNVHGHATIVQLEETATESITAATGDVTMEDAPPAARTQTFIDTYEDAGKPLEYVPQNELDLESFIYPFKSLRDYKLACWFTKSKVSQASIKEFFQMGILEDDECSFTSAHTLNKQIDKMKDKKLEFKSKDVDFGIPGHTTNKLWYRDPVKIATYLVQQPALAERMVWAPIREYRDVRRREEDRVFGEMHTGNWWWLTQMRTPRGGTVLPIICYSDGTHLTNFSGDKKAWPIYMSIGNLPSHVRNAPSFNAFVLLALLPISPKKERLSTAQKALISEKIQELLAFIMQPLADLCKPMPAATQPVDPNWPAPPPSFEHQGIRIACGDGAVRQCYPVLSAWAADHMEYTELLGLKSKSCPRCEVLPTQLGQPLGPDLHPARRNYAAYEEIKDAIRLETTSVRKRRELVKRLEDLGLHNRPLGLCQLPTVCVRPSYLHKPDLLHGIYKGLLEDVIDCSIAFLKKHNRLDGFDQVWCTIAKYPDFSGFSRPYSSITQWQGKELRAAGRVFLAAFAVSLQNPSQQQRAAFHSAISCTRSFLDFHRIAQYKSHDIGTIELLQGYWKDFCSQRAIFKEFRVIKSRRNIATAHTAKLEALKEALDLRQLTRDAYDREVALENAAFKAKNDQNDGFNYIKMHLPNHYVEHIREFGHLQGFSTDAGELQHREQLKEGYRHSNKVNATEQMLEFYIRQHIFRMGELNLISHARKSPASFWKVHNAFRGLKDNDIELDKHVIRVEEKQASLTWPLQPVLQQVSARSLKGPRYDIKTIGQMFESYTLSHTHEVLCEYLYRHWVLSTRQRLAGAVRWPVDDITEPEMLRYKCTVFNQLRVNVPSLADPRVVGSVHPIRCTGNKSWHQGGPRKDFVFLNKASSDFVDARSRGDFGNLKGRGVARVDAIFTIADEITGRTYETALVTELKVLYGGWVQPPHGLVVLQQYRGWDAYHNMQYPERRFVPVSDILGLAHVVCQPGRNTAIDQAVYYLNTYIELGVYNDIYEGNRAGEDDDES